MFRPAATRPLKTHHPAKGAGPNHLGGACPCHDMCPPAADTPLRRCQKACPEGAGHWPLSTPASMLGSFDRHLETSASRRGPFKIDVIPMADTGGTPAIFLCTAFAASSCTSEAYHVVPRCAMSQTAAETASTVVMCSSIYPWYCCPHLTVVLCSPVHNLVLLRSPQLQCFARVTAGG